MQAADRTVPEVQAELAERLGNGFLKNPHVTVEITQYVSQRVFVMGEVHTPGAVSLTGPILDDKIPAAPFPLDALRPTGLHNDLSPSRPREEEWL